MTSAEYAEMIAYQRLFGEVTERRKDWRAAIIASTIANVNRDHKRRPRPYGPEDFIPDWAEQAGVKRLPSPAEVAEKTKALFQRLTAKAREARR